MNWITNLGDQLMRIIKLREKSREEFDIETCILFFCVQLYLN